MTHSFFKDQRNKPFRVCSTEDVLSSAQKPYWLVKAQDLESVMLDSGFFLQGASGVVSRAHTTLAVMLQNRKWHWFMAVVRLCVNQFCTGRLFSTLLRMCVCMCICVYVCAYVYVTMCIDSYYCVHLGGLDIGFFQWY